MSDSRNLLRHTLATLAYRGGKAIRNAPASFATYGAPDTARTPLKILAHIGDLVDWGLSMADGKQEMERFHTPGLGPGMRALLRLTEEIRRSSGIREAARRSG